MKKIKQLSSSATELTELQQFLDEHPLMQRTKSDWNAFRDTKGYSDLFKELVSVQHNLCAYCETSLQALSGLDDKEVEHFHPKEDIDHQTDWMFKPDNLFAACLGGSARYRFGDVKEQYRDDTRYLKPLKENLSCGQAKGNQILDAIIYKPSDLPAFPLLFRIRRNPAKKPAQAFPPEERDGALLVDSQACQTANIDVEKLSATIERLNLNCPRLCRARTEIRNNLDKHYAMLDADADEIENAARLELWEVIEIDGDEKCKLPAFFSTIRFYFSYISGGTSESILQTTQQTWV